MNCALSLVGMVRYDEGFSQESVAKVGSTRASYAVPCLHNRD